MSISLENVEHVAKLARLYLSDEEKHDMVDQLNKVLTFAEHINAVDTTDVAPTSHVLNVQNVMREDVVKPSLDREWVLKNAPDSDEGQFRVPAVLDEPKDRTGA